jgi:hypothetical protein
MAMGIHREGGGMSGMRGVGSKTMVELAVGGTGISMNLFRVTYRL